MLFVLSVTGEALLEVLPFFDEVPAVDELSFLEDMKKNFFFFSFFSRFVVVS